MTSPPNYQWQQFLERTFPAYPLPPPSTSAPGGTDIELKMAAQGSSPSRLEDGTAMPGVPGVPAPKFSYQNTFAKWFVDCITLGAVMNTVAFLVLMGTMKGQSWSQIKSNIGTVCLTSRGVSCCCTNEARKWCPSLWLATRCGLLLPSSASRLFRYIGASCSLASSASSGVST